MFSIRTAVLPLLGLLTLALHTAADDAPAVSARPGNMNNLTVRRFDTNPLISPHAGPRIGTNVNGPSVIRVPEWLPNPLGKYYLYFADHKGPDIRLAYADELAGPREIYAPATLKLAQ